MVRVVPSDVQVPFSGFLKSPIDAHSSDLDSPRTRTVLPDMMVVCCKRPSWWIDGETAPLAQRSMTAVPTCSRHGTASAWQKQL